MSRLRKAVPRNIVLFAFPRTMAMRRSMWRFRMSLMQAPIPVPAPPLACAMALAWRLPPAEAAIAPVQVGDQVGDRVGDRAGDPSSGTG